MNASPRPVAETAHSSSAQVPAPTSGESPMRPGSFPVYPPVEVAAARRPRASRGPGGEDRVADALHGGDRACRLRGAVHHRGVHLVLAGGVEDRAAPGVEERAVLERDDRGRDGVKGRAASFQDRVALEQAVLERRGVLELARRRHPFPGQRSGAAVDRDHGRARH